MKKRTDLPFNIKKFLSKFPNDATLWKSATDEIRDICKDIRELYNEYNENDKIEALNFRAIKTPAECNTKAKEYIIDTFKKMNSKIQDLFIKDFEKRWLTKESFVKSFEDFKLNEEYIWKIKYWDLCAELLGRLGKIKKNELVYIDGKFIYKYEPLHQNFLLSISNIWNKFRDIGLDDNEIEKLTTKYIKTLYDVNDDIRTGKMEYSDKEDKYNIKYRNSISNRYDFQNEKKKESEEIKIKGSVLVEFEMSSDRINREEMIEYMRNQLEQHLTEEWQSSSCYPDMSTFKISK